MNIRSPSFPNGLEGLRSESQVRGISMVEVINRGAYSHLGMSDDQLDNEHRAQKRLYAALDELCKAVREVNISSAVVSIENSEVEAFIHDAIPTEGYWDEQISIARRG